MLKFQRISTYKACKRNVYESACLAKWWVFVYEVSGYRFESHWSHLTLIKLSFFEIKYPGQKGPPFINPAPVKPIISYIRSFKKYQKSNQGHVTFLMTSSYFKTVIQVKYFYE